MPKVAMTPRIEVDLGEVLEGVSRLETGDLERFADQVLALRARRRAPSLTQEESELRRRVNEAIPADTWERYHALNDQLHDETITPQEHRELMALVDAIESANAERMAHLVALAQLRNLSLDQLLEELGLRRSLNG